MGLRYRLKGTKIWHEGIGPKKPVEIRKLYEQGFSGVYTDYEARERRIDSVRAAGFKPMAEDALTTAGLADSGAGKLGLAFLAAAHLFPNCYPSAAQERGDCVSHGSAGAALMTLANDIWKALPDESTKVVEGVPNIPRKGVTEGVIPSAYQWWLRRSGGDGWDCDTAAECMVSEGTLLMQPYSTLGIDLTEYSYEATSKYASRGPPANLIAESKQHIIRTSAVCDSFESTRDMLYNGFGMFDCGGEAWTSETDENGVAKRSGSWSHSMKNGAVDDREETKKLYGGPLLLIINNWGEWNSSTSRDIRDSAKYVPASLKKYWESIDLVNQATGNIMRPKGSFWTRWKDAQNRYRAAYSGAQGWIGNDSMLVV